MYNSLLIGTFLYLTTLFSTSLATVNMPPQALESLKPKASLNMGLPQAKFTQGLADALFRNQVIGLLNSIEGDLSSANNPSQNQTNQVFARQVASFAQLASDKILSMLSKNSSHLQINLDLYHLQDRIYALSIKQWQNIADDSSDQLIEGDEFFSEVQVYNF